MSRNVMVTGTGRTYALGYNMVLRYLENGDTVIATVRKESEDLNKLKEQYGDKLRILIMDISSTESVEAARKNFPSDITHIDTLINNAVGVSPDCDKEIWDMNLDYIASTVNITGVGALRVIKAFRDIIMNGEDTGLIINITSEAGSISKCYRTNLVDYGIAKAALNMGTMNIANAIKDNPKINIFCVHPGWIRTNGDPENPAPLSSYEAAEILRLMFETKRYDKTGPRFITNEGVEYPF